MGEHKRANRLEKELQDLTERFQKLEEEAEEMRKELARRNNTRTVGCQTNLTGDKIDGQAKEMKRLRVMLEELQTKMKELVSRCRAKFGAEVKDIAEYLG